MSLYDAAFKLKHECPFRDLSEQYPGLTIREWHLSDCQVLELTASGVDYEALREDVERLGPILHDVVDDEGLHVVARSCQCPIEESIITRFEAHNCLYLPPTVYQRGWEHYSVVAFDESDILGLFAELDADREIQVISKTEVDERKNPLDMLFSTNRLFDGLTDRQLEALRVALDAGYFEQPRKATVEELAAKTTVARPTYEEHLRKAQNKLVSNVGQFVRLFTEQGAGTGLRASASPMEVAGESD